MFPLRCKAVRIFYLYLLINKTFVQSSQQIFYTTFGNQDSDSELADIRYDPIHNTYPIIHLPTSCPFIPLESCNKKTSYWKQFEDRCNLSSYCRNGTHAQCVENKEYPWKNVLLVCAPIGNCDRDARNIVYYDEARPNFYKLGKKKCEDGQYHSNQNFCFGDCITDRTVHIHQRSTTTAPATAYCNYHLGYCNADKPMLFEWANDPDKCYLAYDKGHRSCPSGKEGMPDCSCDSFCNDGYVRDPSNNFRCKISPELLLSANHIRLEQKVDVIHHAAGLRLVWRFSSENVQAVETLTVTYWDEEGTREKVALGTNDYPAAGYTDIEDLSPGQTYVFEIQIVYKQDGSTTNVTIHKSQTTRPKPVENITGSLIAGNIELRWEAPRKSKQDKYRVESRMVRRNRKPSWSRNTTHDCKFTLHRPFPGEEYELRVFSISNGTASEGRATSLVIPPLSPKRLHHHFPFPSVPIVDVFWFKNDSRSHVEKWRVRYNKSNGDQSIDVPLPDNGLRVDARITELRQGQTYNIFVYSLVGDMISTVPASITIKDDVTITQLDCLPTQELFNVNIINNDVRYANVLPETSADLDKRKLERLPKSTRKQNCWAMNAYIDWASWRNNRAETILGDDGAVPADLWNQSLGCMNFWMARFIVECRRKDGTPYPPNTLYNITASIQRTLRDQYGRNEVNMLDTSNVHFAEFRKQLDGRMKELTSQGIGIHRQRADPVTDEDETRLWDSGVIGLLSNGVFFYNCKFFGFRGGDEHRDLNTSQYRFTMESGQQCLTFYGRNSKNVQGGLKHRKVEPKVIKQYADLSNPRCVVKLFETYLQAIPDGDFYLRPLPGKPSSPVLFSSQKIGANYLSKLMKTMFEDAGIATSSRNIRNHSGKVTLCTRLYDNKFDEQAIMARSGHRSVAVRDYKRPSDELIKSVSAALQPSHTAPRIETPPPISEPKIEPEMKANTPRPTTNVADGCLEITVHSGIHTIVVNKDGRKISVTL